MSDIAIRVENLSKRYKIGKRVKYKTFRDVLTDCMKAPVRRLHSMFSNSVERKHLRYDEIWALKDVSFEVHRGEAVGVIGRNGAGKSTLLKLLSRITAPTKGGADVYGRVGSLLEVGTGFHPELTGRENVFLNGAILGMRKHEISSRFDEIIAFAEVEKFIDTPVKHYSSGMFVRLAFAVAAHLEPEILLVDEILAVGDAEFQRKCLTKMEDVSKGGRTVLFVSHNMLAIKNLCTSAIFLSQGSSEYFSDLGSAVQKYLSVDEDTSGEVKWESPEDAPGNHQVRLKAVRIVADDHVAGSPSVDQDIDIQIDYWNLEQEGRRLLSVHILNSMGYTLFTSANFKSGAIDPDPWIEKKYPIGLFRTSCTIPKLLLNPGRHSITLFINGRMACDSIIIERNVIYFDVKESDYLRSDYLGEWVGAVRPLLRWQTQQLA
jgi:lipopolysaccharide transport system ATP-binding protein